MTTGISEGKKKNNIQVGHTFPQKTTASLTIYYKHLFKVNKKCFRAALCREKSINALVLYSCTQTSGGNIAAKLNYSHFGHKRKEFSEKNPSAHQQ